MLDYVLIVVGALMAAFYSGSETGFYCLNRLRLRIRSEQGDRAARVLHGLASSPQLLISSMLVGTNIGIYMATVVFTEQLRRAGYAARADLYSSLILPPMLLVFAEILPKSLFQHHAELLMYHTAVPLKLSQLVFYPAAAFLRAVSRIPQKLLHKRLTPRPPGLTRDTFQFYLSEGAAEGALSSFQRTMAENIMRLKSVRVDTTMISLSEVVMISEDASYADLSEVLRGHRYSRLPVWRERRANIVGMINVLDVASAAEREPSVAELQRGVLTIERDVSVADALSLLRRAKQQFAVVTDERQQAVGILTAKDLVEEIVGELEAW